MGIVLYTHSDYADVWPMFFGQIEKHLSWDKKYVLVDREDSRISPDWHQVIYDEKEKYTDRIIQGLEKIDSSTILFIHEDMVLYEPADVEILKEFCGLVESGEADFIKLIKAGSENFNQSTVHKNLVECPDDLLFTIQPTICDTSKLKNIFLGTSRPMSIWDFERNSADICRGKGYTKCFMSSAEGEEKRGSAHWDSKIFPYIATAIVKGKWNLEEYRKELNPLFKEYNIDPKERNN